MLNIATHWNWGEGKLNVMSSNSGVRHRTRYGSMKLELVSHNLKIEKLRFRDLKQLVQTHTAGKLRDWDHGLHTVFLKSSFLELLKTSLPAGSKPPNHVWRAYLPEQSGQPWFQVFCPVFSISALTVVIGTWLGESGTPPPCVDHDENPPKWKLFGRWRGHSSHYSWKIVIVRSSSRCRGAQQVSTCPGLPLSIPSSPLWPSTLLADSGSGPPPSTWLHTHGVGNHSAPALDRSLHTPPRCGPTVVLDTLDFAKWLVSSSFSDPPTFPPDLHFLSSSHNGWSMVPIILGWPKSYFDPFCNILQKNLNELYAMESPEETLSPTQ